MALSVPDLGQRAISFFSFFSMKDVDPFYMFVLHINHTNSEITTCSVWCTCIFGLGYVVTFLFWGPRGLASNSQIRELSRPEFVHTSMDTDILLILTRPSLLDDLGVDDILDLYLHRLADLMNRNMNIYE